MSAAPTADREPASAKALRVKAAAIDQDAASDALVDPLNVAALRVVLGATEADAATRLRKELEALKARVGDGAPDRPLHDDDVIELEFRAEGVTRVLVRHLPAKLRTLCDWLADGCTHQGQRFTLLSYPHGLDQLIELNAKDDITEAIVAAAGVEPRGDDEVGENLMHYHETKLTDTLSVHEAVSDIVYVAAWAIQNHLHGKLLVPLGWANDVDDEFVDDHVAEAVEQFGTGPLLRERIAARRDAGEATPEALTIEDVADAAHVAWKTIVEADEQMQNKLAGCSIDHSSTPMAEFGGGANAAREWHGWQYLGGYEDEKYDAYRQAPRFTLVSEDDNDTNDTWEAAHAHFHFK